MIKNRLYRNICFIYPLYFLGYSIIFGMTMLPFKAILPLFGLDLEWYSIALTIVFYVLFFILAGIQTNKHFKAERKEFFRLLQVIRELSEKGLFERSLNQLNQLLSKIGVWEIDLNWFYRFGNSLRHFIVLEKCIEQKKLWSIEDLIPLYAPYPFFVKDEKFLFCEYSDMYDLVNTIASVNSAKQYFKISEESIIFYDFEPIPPQVTQKRLQDIEKAMISAKRPVMDIISYWLSITLNFCVFLMISAIGGIYIIDLFNKIIMSK